MIEYILFILGFVFLIKGADLLVTGASALASRMGVSKLVIGLTIVAFGTSMPELIVNVIAALGGTGDIALGNVIGSNLANLLLILGLTAVFLPPKLHEATVWKEIPFSLLAVVVLFILANDFLIDNISVFTLTRADGLIMLCFFAIFLYYLFGLFKNNNEKKVEEKQEKTHIIVLMLIAGLIGLYFGGQWIVDGAVFIARNFGLSEFLISATIIAIGTSLPELVTSATAIMKKNVDLAVGNVVGSNIFNIFLVLGVTSTIRPLPIPTFLNSDLLFLGAATSILFLLMFVGRRHRLDRHQGAMLFAIYIAYMVFIIIRG